MKKIYKFRGKEKGGRGDVEFIHGYFAEKFNDDGELVPVIIWDTENPAYYSEVYPESIAQFVGYDRNGKEVYDNDILIDEYGEEVDDFVEVLGKYNFGDTFHDYKLKEN